MLVSRIGYSVLSMSYAFVHRFHGKGLQQIGPGVRQELLAAAAMGPLYVRLDLPCGFWNRHRSGAADQSEAAATIAATNAAWSQLPAGAPQTIQGLGATGHMALPPHASHYGPDSAVGAGMGGAGLGTGAPEP